MNKIGKLGHFRSFLQTTWLTVFYESGVSLKEYLYHYGTSDRPFLYILLVFYFLAHIYNNLDIVKVRNQKCFNKKKIIQSYSNKIQLV